VVIAIVILAHARAKTDGLAVLAEAKTEKLEMLRTTGYVQQLTNPILSTELPARPPITMSQLWQF
jgi:hypothetical protein